MFAKSALATLAVAALSWAAGQSRAADIFAGIYAHGLATPTGSEKAEDVMVGARTAPIQSLWWLGKPSVDAMLSINTQVRTDFVAVGLNWPIGLSAGGKVYLRPAFGLAYTDGEANVGNAYAPGLSATEMQRRLYLSQTRIDFGSKELFKEELALGYKVTPKISAELSYIHLSNGQIFHQGKNQGLDDAGLRVAYSF